MPFGRNRIKLTRTTPALPVRDVPAACAGYRRGFGFETLHAESDFAVLERDDARLHLWRAGDLGWAGRQDLQVQPIRSGAESFLAGTASCRIETTGIEALYAELSKTGVLHEVSLAGPIETGFGTREFATVDLDGNQIEFYRWLARR